MKLLFKTKIPMLLFVNLVVILLYSVVTLIDFIIGAQSSGAVDSQYRLAGAAIRNTIVDGGIIYSCIFTFQKKTNWWRTLIVLLTAKNIFQALEFSTGFGRNYPGEYGPILGFLLGFSMFALINGTLITLLSTKSSRDYLGLSSKSNI